MAREEINRLYNEAATAHQQAKSILDEFVTKDMPEEKARQVDAFLDEFDEKTGRAQQLERELKASERMAEFNAPAGRLGNGGIAAEKGDDPTMEQKAFARYLRHGVKGLSEAERKALRADDGEAGGYLVAPMQFAQRLLKFVDDQVVIRQLAHQESVTTAESLGVLSMDSDLSDYEWTTELATGADDVVKPFGRRALKPHPLAKRVKISNTLIRRSTRPVETIVQERLAYKLAVTMEKAYMTGDGAQKPLGLFVASSDGIPTSRDVSYVVTNDKTKVDALIDMKYAIKAQYQMSDSTRWLMHRDFAKAIRKLRDANEQLIWQPGLQAGQPTLLLDVPVVMSEFAPNTISAGNYLALLGDLQFYWIADALDLQIQVLYELYAETNQRGYIARAETDGAPMLAEAFARLKHA